MKVAGESVLAVAMPVPSAVDFDASGFAGKTVIANGDALILSDLRRTASLKSPAFSGVYETSYVPSFLSTTLQYKSPNITVIYSPPSGLTLFVESRV